MTQDKRRISLLVLAVIALLAALWGGWVRLGWDWPELQPDLIAFHGVLMISGFLGTLIALERAVALNEPWMYAGPLLSGSGSVALILGFNGLPVRLMITAASLLLVFIFYTILRKHKAPYTVVMALGSAAWLIGNLLWLLNWPIFRLVPWWVGFLVLTIAGERLELGRIRRPNPTVTNLFYASTALFLIGMAVSLVVPDAGIRLLGLGMLSMAAWLVRYDIARRTIRQIRLPRFTAASLLTGYFWLGTGGLLAVIYGAVPAGPAYDAWLHCVFVGFVIAMIFGHAPIIFPAVLGLQVHYSWSYYIPLVLLDASVAIRILGDVLLNQPLRLWGGLLNGISILLFLALFLISALRSNWAAAGSAAGSINGNDR